MSELQMEALDNLAGLLAQLIRSTKRLETLGKSDSLYEHGSGSDSLITRWRQEVTKSYGLDTALREKWGTMNFVPEGARKDLTSGLEAAKSARNHPPAIVAQISTQSGSTQE
jgi:hypothetical protein